MVPTNVFFSPLAFSQNQFFFCGGTHRYYHHLVWGEAHPRPEVEMVEIGVTFNMSTAISFLKHVNRNHSLKPYLSSKQRASPSLSPYQGAEGASEENRRNHLCVRTAVITIVEYLAKLASLEQPFCSSAHNPFSAFQKCPQSPQG